MMNQQPGHRTCRELCEDPSQNPNGEGAELRARTQEQCACWSTAGDKALDGENLQEELLLDLSVDMTGVVGAFVATDSDPAGKLQVLHGFLRHQGTSLNRGWVFTYLNDVEGLDLDIVEPDEDLLEVAPETRIYTSVDRQLQRFDGDAALQVVPRHAANAANTQAVKTRMAMCFPYPLVPYVINQNLTPRQAISTLVPIIRDLELEPHVAPSLDFLMVASTATVGGPPATAVESLGTAPDLGVAQVANNRRKKLLFVQLPLSLRCTFSTLAPKWVSGS